VPSGQLWSGLDQRRRLGAAAFASPCRVWHARGQGFKSPQLHPGERPSPPSTASTTAQVGRSAKGRCGSKSALCCDSASGPEEPRLRDGRGLAQEDQCLADSARWGRAIWAGVDVASSWGSEQTDGADLPPVVGPSDRPSVSPNQLGHAGPPGTGWAISNVGARHALCWMTASERLAELVARSP
jgi:hypothetical protein